MSTFSAYEISSQFNISGGVTSFLPTLMRLENVETGSHKRKRLTFLDVPLQREGYPETRIFCSNVGYVLAQTICFIFCKHEDRSNLKQIVCAKTQPTLLQKILVSGYPSLCLGL